MGKPTVYVVNRSGHDFSAAENWGKIIFLSEGKISKYATTEIYREFVEGLADSRPEDFILPTGLSIMSIIACCIFTQMHHGKINLLLYKEGRYVERRLILTELLEIKDE